MTYDEDYAGMMEEDAEVLEQARRTREKDVRERLQLRDVLDRYDARAVLWRVLAQCGIYHSAPLTGGEDVTRFEGRRDIGLWLLSQIEAASGSAYSQMRAEAIEREASKGEQV